MKVGGLASLAAAAALGLGVAGCNGSAAALVRRGSPAACTAPAVHKAMEAFLMPHAETPDHFSGAMKARVAAADEALPRVAVTFDNTTLDAFDKDAGVVSCSTDLAVKLDTLTAAPVRWTYTVQPAAEGGKVIITSEDTASHDAIFGVIRRYLNDKVGP